jgi:hypothetical protein
LGGSPAGFHVAFVKDRHFKFVVSCKQVGFMICDLKRVISEHFDIYFHLWRDGGANWVREEKHWLQEEEQSWTKKTNEKKKPNLKNKDIDSKKVHFSAKLVRDSPARKFVPREEKIKTPTRFINFGSFVCVLEGFSELKGEDDAQMSRKVFGTIKRVLRTEGNSDIEIPPQSGFKSYLSNRARIL